MRDFDLTVNPYSAPTKGAWYLYVQALKDEQENEVRRYFDLFKHYSAKAKVWWLCEQVCEEFDLKHHDRN